MQKDVESSRWQACCVLSVLSVLQTVTHSLPPTQQTNVTHQHIQHIMRFFFLTLLLLTLAVAHSRPLTASPAASKKAQAPSVKSRWAAAAPSAKARWAAAAPALAPRTAYAATSKLSAQFEAVEPQADVSLASPAGVNEAAAYAVAEMVAEATGSAEEAENAAQAALEV